MSRNFVAINCCGSVKFYDRCTGNLKFQLTEGFRYMIRIEQNGNVDVIGSTPEPGLTFIIENPSGLRFTVTSYQNNNPMFTVQGTETVIENIPIPECSTGCCNGTPCDMYSESNFMLLSIHIMGPCEGDCFGVCPAGQKCVKSGNTFKCISQTSVPYVSTTECSNTNPTGTCPEGQKCKSDSAGNYSCQSEKKKLPWWAWLLIAIGILIVLIILGFLIYKLAKPKKVVPPPTPVESIENV